MIRPFLILIVCCEPNLRRSFDLMLEKAGYLIYSVANSQTGCELLEKTKFDLIIVSAYEPEISQSEILTRITSDYFDTPVLLLTESTPPQALIKHRQSPGLRHLTQPILPAKFLNTVAQILT